MVPQQKKGEGLPLNTIIVAIMVVVVLVVIVSFFLGGATGITNTIKRVFFGTTAGTDLTLAVETCRQYCSQAEGLPKELQGTSAYCKQNFNIDEDRDGEADRAEQTDADGKRPFLAWKCTVGTSTATEKFLNIPCDVTC